MKQREAQEKRDYLSKEGEVVRQSCQKKMAEAAADVEHKLSVAIWGMASKLPGLVKEFKEQGFNPDTIAPYQQKLCAFVDARMSEMLEETASSLGAVHNEAKEHIIGEREGH